jgi:hypothetical protein
MYSCDTGAALAFRMTVKTNALHDHVLLPFVLIDASTFVWNEIGRVSTMLVHLDGRV